MLRLVTRNIFKLSRNFSSHTTADVKPTTKKKTLTQEEIMEKKTPKGKFDQIRTKEDPYLWRHPGGVNPETGEVGGPAGPEPTRYGDWERKGRVTDF
ncbi:hypothetical protein AB6A40_000812 [Gnathostoma spinigerum]|uniref:Succinate dehydrogenase assembly factor 4, mitochondrial n=1 Tax=Gnathostoma spinigerum TaxID=75299 RepID=A0ABD6E2X7_9BILA